jgi:hypothetical protein
MSASYAALHRLAVREATRVELQRALAEIEAAKFAAVGRRGRHAVHCYGTRAECDAFAEGLERDVKVVPMSADLKEICAAHKVRAYRC